MFARARETTTRAPYSCRDCGREWEPVGQESACRLCATNLASSWRRPRAKPKGEPASRVGEDCVDHFWHEKQWAVARRGRTNYFRTRTLLSLPDFGSSAVYSPSLLVAVVFTSSRSVTRSPAYPARLSRLLRLTSIASIEYSRPIASIRSSTSCQRDCSSFCCTGRFVACKRRGLLQVALACAARRGLPARAFFSQTCTCVSCRCVV